LQSEKKSKEITLVLIFGLILIVYLLFPSHNNSGDAWSYAADARYGLELFSPHHLLYTVTLYILKIYTGCNPLWLGMCMNSIFAVFSCIVLFCILKIISNNPLRSLVLTAMVAFSYGFWRFATENENYIVPIFFSLLGSLYFVKSYTKGIYSYYYLIISGLFATIGCLYHQIHIFWFLGLLFGWIWIGGSFSLKRGLVFSATFIIAPIAYFLVIAFYMHQSINFYNVIHFVFHDYYIGDARVHVGFDNFILGFISFIRTFFQLHGQIAVMVRNHLYWVIPGIITGMLLLIGIALLIRRLKGNKSSIKWSNQDIITKTHILIFVLQLAFAVYSFGNAEFMVMLPALSAIIVVRTEWIPVKSLAIFVIALFICNFSYGIYPNYRMHFNANEKVAQYMIDHPKDRFIVAQPDIVSNQYYYKVGHWPKNLWLSLATYENRGLMPVLKAQVDSFLTAGGVIYTDYTAFPRIINRATMIYNNQDFFRDYNLKDTVVVFETDAGKHCIIKMSR